MSQLGGMAWYEFLMQWRRRGMRVIGLTMILCVCAGVFIMSAAQDDPTLHMAFQALPPNAVIDLLVTFGVLPTLMMIAIFVLPVVSSESVPIDRQLGTHELLSTMPLTPAVYLAGKLAGLWLAALSVTLFTLIGAAVLFYAALGPYNLTNYLENWAAFALVLLLNSGIAILVGATQPTRGRAAVVLIAVLALSIFLALGDLRAPTVLMLASPARLSLLTLFLDNPVGGGAFGRLLSPISTQTIAFGVIEFGILFALILYIRRERVGA